MKQAVVMAGIALFLVCSTRAGDMESYRGKYEDALGQINLEHGVKTTDLGQQYRTALDGLLGRVKRAGDFVKTKAVLAEIDRFSEEKAMLSEPAALMDIKSYQSEYSRKLASLQVGNAKRTIILAQQYDNALLKLQRRLTSSSELDKASSVHDQREELKQSAEVVSAKSLLAEYANVSGARRGQPESTAPAPNPLSVSIASESERKFTTHLIEIGTPLYQDRDYVFTDVPEALTGAIYIQPTAGARGPMHVSKRGGSSDDQLKGDVTVSKSCNMYILVAPQDAGSAAPSKKELSDLRRHGWRELGEEADAGPAGKRSIFTKRIASGRVSFKYLSTERLYAFQ